MERRISQVKHPSIDMIAVVAPVFDKIGEDVLFVGGSVVPLYVPQYLWNWIRPTNDVDGVVEVASHREFVQLERKLEAEGFLHDTSEGAPICRWKYRSVVIDIMPDDESVLGFSNRWYRDGRKYAQKLEIETGIFIHILPHAFFLATKIDAFLSRGRNDFFGSPDIEDIVCVLDGCSQNTIMDILRAPKTVLDYLRISFSEFQRSQDFLDSLSGHIEPGVTHDERVRNILQKILHILSV
jgi:hypothetical protein